MRSHSTLALLLASVTSLALASDATAQGLRLEVQGGSYPGTLQAKLGPSQVGRGCAVLFDITPGPTPLALVDRRDPRLLSVGTNFLGQSLAGVYLPPSGVFVPPPWTVPNNPSFKDAALYFQGIEFPGTRYLIGNLSNPAAVRFAPKMTFRDRGVKVKTTRSFASALPYGEGQWMVAGGGQGNIMAPVPLKTSEVYDVVNDAWGPGPSLVRERTIHTATRLNDGRWLLVGGLDIQQRPQSHCEIWDPQTKKFTVAAPMAFNRAGHSAILLPNGKVWVTGGFATPPNPGNIVTVFLSALQETELYDPSTDKWSRGPNLLLPRTQHSMALLPSGRVLILAGGGWVRILIKIPVLFKDCSIFDPKTNKVTKSTPMHLQRGAFSLARLDQNRWIVAGGGSSLDLKAPGAPTKTAEIYDARNDTWTKAGSMAQARTFAPAIPLGNNKWMFTGGADGSLFGLNALQNTDIYDSVAQTWTKGPNLASPRAGPAVFLTPMGQTHLISGQGAGNLGSFSTEMFYR